MKNKLFFLCPAFILFLQITVTLPAQNVDFPLAWNGKWKGSLQLHEGSFDHALISCFAVMGSLICSKLTFNKKTIVYKIHSGPSKAVLSSGGERGSAFRYILPDWILSPR